MRPHVWIWVALLWISTVCACGRGASAPSSTGLTGVWGGDHIMLTIDDSGGHVEFDCAHGIIQGPPALDSHRAFSAGGRYVREHGGPIRDDEAPDSHPASYAGSISGASMVLTVWLTDTNTFIGTFGLTHQVTGRIVKCL